MSVGRWPRIARAAQPWTAGQNAVGVFAAPSCNVRHILVRFPAMPPSFFTAAVLTVLLIVPTGRAATDTQQPARYQGNGLCAFALEGYVLTPQVEESINRVVR